MEESTSKTKKRGLFGEMDLTQGNLFWKVPLFALPMALSTFFQLFYTTVDLFTVATWGGGSSSMSAVGSNGALINLIITVFVSLSMGTNVVISNAKGAGDAKHAEDLLHTSMIISLITGVFVGILGAFLSRYFLIWMGTNQDIIEQATTYLTIYFIGVPFLMIYNYASQIMRALGDSKTPLFALFIAGVANIGADCLFVIVFHLDVAGVGWATVISEAIAAIVCVLSLRFKKDAYVSLRFKKLKFNYKCFNEIMRIGLPAGLQGLAFCIPNVLIQSSLYSLTDGAMSNHDIVVGATASGNVENYLFALIDSCSAACVAFAGQNYGAKKKENCKKVFWYCQAWMMIFWVFGCTASLVFGKDFLTIFINGNDGMTNVEDAITAGYQRLALMSLFYCLDGVMSISSGYMRGMRFSNTPALIIFIGCTCTRVVFLLWIFPLPGFHTLLWLYGAFPISWILTDIADIIAVLIIQPKAFKKMEMPTHLMEEGKTLRRG